MKKGQRYLRNVRNILKNDLNERKMMTRIDVKMMDSKELRTLRTMIRKELDFRAEIGEELEDGRIKEWISAAEYSARIQKEKQSVKENDTTSE